MKSDIRFILKLIASVVLDLETPEAPADVNWESILKIASIHNVANIVAYGISKGGYDVPLQIKAQFDLKLYERMTVSDNQNSEVKKILNSFDDNKIDYMPLKGILLQDLYPSRDMRFMADMDILIRPEQKEEFHRIMTSFGYDFKCESNHEYVYFKKPYVSVELHKLLIPSYNEDMYAYYGDGWKRAKKCEGYDNRYELGVEDNFIYIFTHFAKHYRDGGIGIKAVLDIFLYLEKYKNTDREYIKNQLSKLNLDKFYEKVLNLISVWFYNKEFDEVSMIMTEFIINSGTFGNLQNHISAKTIRETKNLENAEKFKYIRFIFPNLKKMKGIFPVLEKFPALLPFLWVWRVIRFVIFRRDKFNEHKKNIESVDNESVMLYDKHMREIGLDIYNGRKN